MDPLKGGEGLRSSYKIFSLACIAGFSPHLTHERHHKLKGSGKEPQLLVRSDERVANMQNKIESLADQVADIALIIIKN